MKSILIKDTTREEREQIVRQSLWGDCGIECEFCSGCDNRGGGTLASLYQPYIDGEKEIREINADVTIGEEERWHLFISHISMARRRSARSMRNIAHHLYAD